MRNWYIIFFSVKLLSLSFGLHLVALVDIRDDTIRMGKKNVLRQRVSWLRWFSTIKVCLIVGQHVDGVCETQSDCATRCIVLYFQRPTLILCVSVLHSMTIIKIILETRQLSSEQKEKQNSHFVRNPEIISYF